MASYAAFDKTTTCEDVVTAFKNVANDKTILVTGISPNGLGEAMIRALAAQAVGHLILTARSPEKAVAVIDSIKADNPQTKMTFEAVQIDLSSIESVRRAVAGLSSNTEMKPIDIIINNAGVMAVPERTTSVDGQEMHFATNFLGHWLLTNLLRKHNLLSKNGARAVNVTSGGYMVCPIRFSDITWAKTFGDSPEDEQPNWAIAEKLGMGGVVNDNAEKNYDPMLAYLHSNAASMLLSVALSSKTDIVAISAAPGVVVTELQRHIGGFRNPLMEYKTHTQGASSFLVAALDPGLAHHKAAYIDDCQVLEVAASYFKDEAVANRLWNLAESIVGEKF